MCPRKLFPPLVRLVNPARHTGHGAPGWAVLILSFRSQSFRLRTLCGTRALLASTPGPLPSPRRVPRLETGSRVGCMTPRPGVPPFVPRNDCNQRKEKHHEHIQETSLPRRRRPSTRRPVRLRRNRRCLADQEQRLGHPAQRPPARGYDPSIPDRGQKAFGSCSNAVTAKPRQGSLPGLFLFHTATITSHNREKNPY